MAEAQEIFRQLLITLLSSDNDARTQAEETYSRLPVEYKVAQLVGALHNTSLREETRQMAAVLLRRLLSSEFQECYPKLSSEAQTHLKNQLMLAVSLDQTECMRRKICEVIAELARNLIDDDGNNTWPEVLQFLFQCANAPSFKLKEAALRIFAAVPGVFGNQQNNYLDLIKEMLRQSLNDEEFDVRFQAVKAIASFLLLHDKEMPLLKHFFDLLPTILQVTLYSIEEQDDDGLLKVLIDLAETVPKYLRPQLPQVFDLCMKIFNNPAMLDSWRHIALEVMVTLMETAPGMVRKLADKHIAALIPQVLNMMTDIEEDNEWGTCDEITEDDSDCNNSVAESSLDRIACGLGGKIVLPLVVNNIPIMLTNPDWKHRHAALMAISAVGEGCHKQMEDILPNIMDAVLRYLQDPHPRVRYAACNAIGQMATDFAPAFEKKFHDRVIPGLLMVLDDNDNPRVQAHAGAALVNFSEDCPKYILTQYLDSIMTKLEAILSAKFKELVEKGTKLVLEQVVTTIASVADTSEKEFCAYYDRLMPCLKYIIQNANTEELKMLRGKTIECVSLIGLAVGGDKFMDDANEIMDLLLKTHSEDMPDDDPQTSYLISAWSRICKVLGKRFEQYLPLVMGPVLRAASMKPEVALIDNDEMQSIEGDVDWQFVSLGEQQNFGIKTAGLEDKANACIMLVTYARELKDGFAEYAEEVVKLMVPMLRFYFHDGVRSAAAESLPYLLECAKIKGSRYLQGMWQYICPELLKSIDTEPETEVLLEMMHSLAHCIETLGNGCLSEHALSELLRILDRMLKEHFERVQNRLKKHLDEDYDEVAEEQLEDEEQDDIYFLSRVGDLMHALFMTYKADFLPYFDQICGHFVQLLEPEKPWSDHQWGLCIFDDIIEYTGPACVKYQHIFLQPLLAYVSDSSPEVRQAAAYGWGLLAQCGGDQFVAEIEKALPLLVNVINDLDSRSSKNVNSTENSIAAVAKILKYRSSHLAHADNLIIMWLSWLPVVEDEDEAPHVYDYLCDLIESNHPLALGSNNENLPRLISIISEALYKIIKPTDPIGIRMINIVRQVQANDTMFQSCLAVLSSEQKQALHNALQTPPSL